MELVSEHRARRFLACFYIRTMVGFSFLTLAWRSCAAHLIALMQEGNRAMCQSRRPDSLQQNHVGICLAG